MRFQEITEGLKTFLTFFRPRISPTLLLDAGARCQIRAERRLFFLKKFHAVFGRSSQTVTGDLSSCCRIRRSRPRTQPEYEL